MNKLIYFFIIFFRLLSAPLIFISPLSAIILSVFLDIIDADFAYQVISKKKYELIDKNLDLWWFINIMIYSALNFPDYKIYLLFLFIFRAIGQLIYYLTNSRRILIFFPNFFEWIFFLIFIGKNYFPIILTTQNYILISLSIVIIKIIQEWFLHVADLSIKEIVFKTKRYWQK